MNQRRGVTILSKWLMVGRRVEGDQASNIIEHLIEGHFILVGERSGHWVRLYLDPTNGFYWEHSYPHSGMHGGGPAALRQLSQKEVQDLYGRLPTDPFEL